MVGMANLIRSCPGLCAVMLGCVDSRISNFSALSVTVSLWPRGFVFPECWPGAFVCQHGVVVVLYTVSSVWFLPE